MLPNLSSYDGLAAQGLTRFGLDRLIESGKFDRIAPHPFLRSGLADDTSAPLPPVLAPMSKCAQRKYHAWLTRSHRDNELPAAFTDVLSAVAGFADPAMTAVATGRCNPRLHVWE